MRCLFFKSLDRPMDIFGIKGKWIFIFIVFFVAVILLGLLVGSITSSGIGITAVIIGGVLDFVGVMMMQEKITERNVKKYDSTAEIYNAVSRKETLGRILLPDKNVPSAFYERHKEEIKPLEEATTDTENSK